jgi:hypothetical protein
VFPPWLALTAGDPFDADWRAAGIEATRFLAVGAGGVTRNFSEFIDPSFNQWAYA